LDAAGTGVKRRIYGEASEICSYLAPKTVRIEETEGVFKCPMDDCVFQSTDFDQFNVHLLVEHSDVFRDYSSLKASESTNGGLLNNELPTSIDSPISELIVANDRSSNGNVNSSQIDGMNVSVVEGLKTDCLLDDGTSCETKSVVLMEVHDSGGGFVKIEDHEQDSEEFLPIQCSNPSTLSVVVVPNIAQAGQMQTGSDTPITSLPNLQYVERELKAEGLLSNAGGVTAEMLMEDSCCTDSATFDEPTAVQLMAPNLSFGGAMANMQFVAGSPYVSDTSTLSENNVIFDDEDGEPGHDDDMLDYTSVGYHPLMHDQHEAALWMFRHRLISNSMLCKLCLHKMVWSEQNTADCFAWKCYNIACEQYKRKRKQFIRSKSIFEDIGLPLGWCLETMRLWSAGLNVRQAVRQRVITMPFLLKTYRRYRDVCADYISKNPQLVGGRDSKCHAHVIEIPVKLCKKRKDEPLRPYVLIVVDMRGATDTRMFSAALLDDLRPESFMRAFQQAVVPKTKICCDRSIPLNELQGLDGTTRSYLQFCEPKSMGFKQDEALRGFLWKFRRDLLASYRFCGFAGRANALAECLWRYRFGANAFENLYPLCERLELSLSLRFPSVMHAPYPLFSKPLNPRACSTKTDPSNAS
uniref:C2H2-type domain-containing protein n=1 Tax=Toxocara canis TaxID=6265 RepID=A0A183TZ37_TOXCA